ncbi:hypothetical protein NQ315_000446 [Exocentrus adspersus]|uniref:PiggyBac transposable element-derived protein domain-containing protein n=1 Tax=Exocentrus adspersus TaxID=1586481 RepID=A0AAV8V5L1_9CUCU|nr:hypothetical protein NQ315_000446 [Exocentrus adspersus]
MSDDWNTSTLAVADILINLQTGGRGQDDAEIPRPDDPEYVPRGAGEVLKSDRYIAVDETMIPFRGRLGFRQYIPGKRHKYEVKIFKMCDRKGYTHSFSVYQGKHEREPEKTLSTDIVLKLCEDQLDHGRVVNR